MTTLVPKLKTHSSHLVHLMLAELNVQFCLSVTTRALKSLPGALTSQRSIAKRKSFGALSMYRTESSKNADLEGFLFCCCLLSRNSHSVIQTMAISSSNHWESCLLLFHDSPVPLSHYLRKQDFGVETDYQSARLLNASMNHFYTLHISP